MVYNCNEMAQKNENWVLTGVKISLQDRFSQEIRQMNEVPGWDMKSIVLAPFNYLVIIWNTQSS